MYAELSRWVRTPTGSPPMELSKHYLTGRTVWIILKIKEIWTDPEDVVGRSKRHHSSLNDVLKALQEQTMKLKDAIHAAEQLLHVVM